MVCWCRSRVSIRYVFPSVVGMALTCYRSMISEKASLRCLTDKNSTIFCNSCSRRDGSRASSRGRLPSAKSTSICSTSSMSL